jgi:hypothetical protein
VPGPENTNESRKNMTETCDQNLDTPAEPGNNSETSFDDLLIETHSAIEDILRERLINFILITWAILGTCGYFLTCLRSLTIGWTTRDMIYTANYAVLMIITLYRHRQIGRAHV